MFGAKFFVCKFFLHAPLFSLELVALVGVHDGLLHTGVSLPVDPHPLSNLSLISKMRRYYMNDRCMNDTELDPCLAAKVRLKHPSDCK